MLEALFRELEAAQGNAAVQAIVITGDQGKFSAGFDITYLAKQQAEGRSNDFGGMVNDALVKLVENGAKPTVAGAPAARRPPVVPLGRNLRDGGCGPCRAQR